MGNFHFTAEFGLNTNLLETNILNLAVVLGVVITLGGEILDTTLTTRKENLLKNFRDIELQLESILADLQIAEENYQAAEKKSMLITSSNVESLKERKQKRFEENERQILTLAQSQQQSLQFEEKTIQNKLWNQFLDSVFSKTTTEVRDSLRNVSLANRTVYTSLSILGGFEDQKI